MSEFNSKHVPFCKCYSCQTHRLSHQAFPESTLNAGLFNIDTAPALLADLVSTRGVKLGDDILKSALTVTVRNTSITHDVLVTAPDNVEYPFRLEPQACVELALPDIATHNVSAMSEGVSVVVSFTRLMSEKAY